MRKVVRAVRRILRFQHTVRAGTGLKKRSAAIGMALLILWGIPVSAANAAEVTQDAVTETTETVNSIGGTGGEVVISNSYNSITHTADNQGMHVGKYLENLDATTLQVTLESYTTGESLMKICPTDIVLLMDLSGSMTRRMVVDGVEQEPRIIALKTAAEAFIDALGKQNEGLDPENQSRLSIVKYSNVNLTEEISDQLTTVSGSGLESLKEKIIGLPEEDVKGRTNMQTALDLAGEILERDGSPDRDQAVVLFTDGAPAPDEGATEIPMDGFVMDTANQALAEAKILKEKGIRVFGVSIMPGINCGRESVPEYDKTFDDTTDYFVADCYNMPYMPSNTTDDNGMRLIDRFMFLLSSDNPHAASMDMPDADNPAGTGKVCADDKINYYSAASSAGELAEVFRTVARSLVRTASEFGPEAEARDFITPDYQLTGTDKVRVYTSDYKGNNTWETPVEITNSDAIHTDVTDNAVRVSGFDYKTNYVAETADGKPHGQKLVITFPIRSRRTFGGNEVPTNTEESGIYENDGTDAKAAVKYPVPYADLQVNYQIQGGEHLVYIPDQVDLSDFIPYPEEYKPDGILNQHVNLTYTLTDPEGNEAAVMTIAAGETPEENGWKWNDSLESPEAVSACGVYQVACRVTPVEKGHYTAAALGDRIRIHVLHPLVTFRDSFQKDGDVVDTPEGEDLKDETSLEEHWDALSWVCPDGLNIPQSGSTPEMGYKVSIPEGVTTEDGKRIIRSEKDIPVVVDLWRISGCDKPVDVTEQTEFLHKCVRDNGCSYESVKKAGDPAGARFMIHLTEILPSTGGIGTKGYLAAAIAMASMLTILKAYQKNASSRSHR